MPIETRTYTHSVMHLSMRSGGQQVIDVSQLGVGEPAVVVGHQIERYNGMVGFLASFGYFVFIGTSDYIPDTRSLKFVRLDHGNALTIVGK